MSIWRGRSSRREAAFATAAAFAVFVVSDIVRPLSATTAWLVELYIMALAIGLVYRSLAFPITLLLLAFMGAEDLFFFLFKLRLPPAQIPGLYSHRLILLQPATPVSLLVGFVLALGIGGVLIYAEGKLKSRLRVQRDG